MVVYRGSNFWVGEIGNDFGVGYRGSDFSVGIDVVILGWG